MSSENLGRDIIQFGDFELDSRSGELWKAGAAVKLQPQPARILVLLASRPGQLVTRDEIRDQIWGKDTFVEFDQSLNFCIRQLRAALGDTADTPQFVETLPRRGYRFVAPVASRDRLGQPSDSLKPPERSRPHPRLAKLLLVLTVLAAGSAGALVAWHYFGGRDEGNGGRVLLAVLPFKNLSGDAGQDYLADGLTEETITRLGQLQPARLGVIARTSSMQYKESSKGIPQIGRELGVAYAIEGGVRRDLSRLRINVQLVDVSTQTVIWAKTYEHDMDDIVALQVEVATAVAESIRIPQRTRGPDSARSGTQKIDPQAYEAYLKGRFYWRKLTRKDVERAIEYFEEATRRSPTYALAYAGLADAYYALSNLHLDPADAMRRVGEAAHRALELDPTLAEAHCSVALVRLYHRWDWSGAENEFKRAIELNPGSAEIRGWYGLYLALMGREDEALDELEEARRLDPLSLLINWTMGLPLYFSGRYDEGIRRTELVLELDSDFYLAHSGLGSLYEAKGDYAKAVAQFRKAAASSDSPEILAYLGRALALSGDRTGAQRILGRLNATPSMRYVSPYDLALVYDGLGEREQAIRCLDDAFQRRAEPMIGLRLDPRMKGLLGDRRVQDLVKRMKLPGLP